MTEMVCEELVDVITEYLEGTLPAEDVERFEQHLTECPFCTAYLEQMRATVDRLGAVPADRLSEDARRGVLDAFKDWRLPPGGPPPGG
ncbi:MAG TPA: zf-HC2 domain-containing protein [Solirubrobacteraceae bacterium]